MAFNFTFKVLRSHYADAFNANYKIIRCCDYVQWKKEKRKERVLVNRVDIDFSPVKARKLAELFNELGIKATFFIRLHAPEYNPFSFENYKIFRFIKESGHEIGYHSEVIDQSVIWKEDAEDCFKRDVEVMNAMFDIRVVGVASHGANTGFNNLDFWKDKKPSDLGMMYEAYDKQPEFNLFQESFYISDSNWTHWKCYNKAVLVEKDFRTLGEHVKDGHDLIYLLIHPETYYEEHFYE